MKPGLALILPLALVGIAVFLYVDDLTLKSTIIAILAIPIVLFFFFRRTVWIWWYARNPPILEEALRTVLLHQSPYFAGLSVELKKRFEQRVFMYLLTNNFEKIELKTLAEEVKALVAAYAVQLTFGFSDKEYLMSDFRTWVFYPTPFITPMIRQFHAGEVHGGLDKSSLTMDNQKEVARILNTSVNCMILAVDRVLKGISESKENYNIALHEMANVFRLSKKIENYNDFKTPNVMQRLALVRGATYQGLLNNTGKPSLDFFAQSVEHLFHNPARFKALLPELYEYLCKVLKQNPLNSEYPLMD